MASTIKLALKNLAAQPALTSSKKHIRELLRETKLLKITLMRTMLLLGRWSIHLPEIISLSIMIRINQWNQGKRKGQPSTWTNLFERVTFPPPEESTWTNFYLQGCQGAVTSILTITFPITTQTAMLINQGVHLWNIEVIFICFDVIL